MNKRIKKKVVGRINKNKIENIFSQMNIFSPIDKRYGDGYFILSFDTNSICWFSLKKFPGWKFGIWMYPDNSYDVFGQAITLIDKFKPSASNLCFSNILDFERELVFINEREPAWIEYLDDKKEGEDRDLIESKFNSIKFKAIVESIQKFNDVNGEKAMLKLVDTTTKHFSSYPRYKVEYYCIEMTKDEEVALALRGFKSLSESIPFEKNMLEFSLDDFSFRYFNGSYIYSKEEFGENVWGWRKDSSLEKYYEEVSS